MQNALGITDPLSAKVSSYFSRPFDEIQGERYADAIAAKIKDLSIRSLPKHISSIDQFVNSTDVLTHANRRRRLVEIYRSE